MKKIFNFIAMISAFLFSLSSYSLNKSNCTCNENNKKSLITLIDEVWSKGNYKVVDQLISPNYTIRHDPGDPWENKTIDLATYKARAKMSRDVFPDQKFYIEDLVCSDNKIAISWRFTGTQEGKIPELPVTNKKVNVSGMTIYYFSQGKIIGHWQVVDRMGLIQQFGLTKKNPAE